MIDKRFQPFRRSTDCDLGSLRDSASVTILDICCEERENYYLWLLESYGHDVRKYNRAYSYLEAQSHLNSTGFL